MTTVATVAIPAWNAQGVLPPVDPEKPTGAVRSPYPVSLKELVVRFATSPERVAVLRGLLAYRASLHLLGMRSGFQWLDGSFLENVEALEGRPPADVDVVTFLEGDAPEEDVPEADSDVLDHATAKARYHVDAYFLELEQLDPRALTKWVAYWYSMWSHRRNQAWKGFLEVELAPHEDAEAQAVLEERERAGETP